MRLTILSFVFIVLWHVSVAQVSSKNNFSQEEQDCPLMEVSLNSNDNDILEVAYCNHGSVLATGVYVEVEVSSDLFIARSTKEFSSLINKKYTFNIRNVESAKCGKFYIEVPNVDERIHCVSVQIFPNDPCQTMIDQYLTDNTGSENYGSRGDFDTNPVSVTLAAERYHSVPNTLTLGEGQGGSNSVFEDHVFLDNIPTWDSLIVVLENSGVQPDSINTNTQNAISIMNGLNDITVLTSTELCFKSRGSTVVLTDVLSQTTSIATDHQTISGGNVNGDLTSSDGSVISDEKLAGGGLNGNEAIIDLERKNYEYNKVEVNLYPNPFTSTATITIDGASYKKMRLEVLDLTGKTLQSLQFNEGEAIILNRDNLNQGIYLYRLIGNDVAVHTGKFIIR